MYFKTSNQPVLELGFNNYTCNWGVHFAGLYKTEEERDQTISGFFPLKISTILMVFSPPGLWIKVPHSSTAYRRSLARDEWQNVGRPINSNSSSLEDHFHIRLS